MPHLVWLCLLSIVFCALLDLPVLGGRASSSPTALSPFEQYAYGFRMMTYGKQRFDLVKAARKKIVLVTLTDDSFPPVPGPPVPREYHAAVIRELKHAGAKVIAFDFLFDQERAGNPEGNSELVAAANESKRVLWGGVTNQINNKPVFSKPIAPLLKASPHLGHINAGDLDYKQVDQPLIDRVKVIANDNGHQVGALSLMAARMAVGDVKGRLTDVPQPDNVKSTPEPIPVDDNGNFKISFLGGGDDVFPTLPYEAVLRGEANNEFYSSHNFFHDKVVLVGDETTFSNDYRFTPIGQMSGVQIHAHALATLLLGCFIRDASPWVNLGLITLMGGIVCPLAASGKLQRLIIGAVLALGFYFLLNVWIFVTYGWWLHLVAPCAALVLSTACVLIERGFFEEREKERMFDALVSAAGSAIERRDPSTSGHSQRVTALTIGLAEAVSKQRNGPFQYVHFSAAQIKELRYAGLLHDFGKIGVRENVLTKSHKLEPHHFEAVMGRLLIARQTIELDFAQRIVELLQSSENNDLEAVEALEAKRDQMLAQINDDVDRLERSNDPMVTYLPDQQYAELQLLLDRLEKIEVVDAFGKKKPVISKSERDALSIRRGSLTPEEYREVQKHAALSFDFLEQIPWTDSLSNIPEIARAHHEKLNGKGYPRGLKEEEIPLQARMMTIADIYDALTAADRPYKKAMPVDKALQILRSEAADGALDVDLLEIFIEQKVYAVTEDWNYVSPSGSEPLSGLQVLAT